MVGRLGCSLALHGWSEKEKHCCQLVAHVWTSCCLPLQHPASWSVDLNRLLPCSLYTRSQKHIEKPKLTNLWQGDQSCISTATESGSGVLSAFQKRAFLAISNPAAAITWLRPKRASYGGKGSFTLRDETMRCRTHDSFITFNNGLGPLKTISGGGGFQGGGRVEGCVGWRYCLEGSEPIFLNGFILSSVWFNMVESYSLNGPYPN